MTNIPSTPANLAQWVSEALDINNLEEILGALRGKHGEGWINITMRERRLFAKLLEDRIVAITAAIGAGGQAVARPLSWIDVLREWFGGERYARDYEYLDANYIDQARRVSEFAATLAHPVPTPQASGVSEAMVEAATKELIAHGEFSSIPGNNEPNARIAAHAALEAALSGEWREPDKWRSKFNLWFFRDLSDEQRLKLFSLHELPVDEIGKVHSFQRKALDRCLPASPAKESSR